MRKPPPRRAAGGGDGAAGGAGHGASSGRLPGPWGSPVRSAYEKRLPPADGCPLRRLFSGGGGGGRSRFRKGRAAARGKARRIARVPRSRRGRRAGLWQGGGARPPVVVAVPLGRHADLSLPQARSKRRRGGRAPALC